MVGIKVEQISPHGPGFSYLIAPHVQLRSLYRTPLERPSGADLTSSDIPHLWSGILGEQINAESWIELRGVRLFEWFPRNPGLYHMQVAKWARDKARHHLLDLDEDLYRSYSATPGAPPDHAAALSDIDPDDYSTRRYIYAPEGKLSMLQGGIGCVRLKSVKMRDLGTSWFMTAASTLAPDEGLPLLVPDHLYRRFIDRIRTVGFATTNIIGRLKFLPDEFVGLYQSSRGIPRIYLEVDQLNDGGNDVGSAQVSVATSFVSENPGDAGIYATYVTFDPAHPGAREGAIDWMENEYVGRLYNGQVLTDFDQIIPAFGRSTLFGLDEVLTSPQLAKTIRKLGKLYGRYDWSVLGKQKVTINERGSTMRVTNKNIGTLNQTLGDNSPINIQLITEMESARANLERAGPSANRDAALESLSEAERAADQGNVNRMKKALKRFVEFGEKVAVGIATAAIKTAAGI